MLRHGTWTLPQIYSMAIESKEGLLDLGNLLGVSDMNTITADLVNYLGVEGKHAQFWTNVIAHRQGSRVVYQECETVFSERL